MPGFLLLGSSTVGPWCPQRRIGFAHDRDDLMGHHEDGCPKALGTGGGCGPLLPTRAELQHCVPIGAAFLQSEWATPQAFCHWWGPACESLGKAFPGGPLEGLEVIGTMNGEWPALHEGGAFHPQMDIWGGVGTRLLPSAFLFTCSGDGCIRV